MSNGAEALQALEKSLKREEEKTVPGADVLRPKQSMLVIPKTTLEHPKNRECHLRWVNLRDAQKPNIRRLVGWERVPESEGGATIGDEYALFRIPKGRRDALVAALEQENRRRTQHAGDDVEQEAEKVVQILRDKYGLKLSNGILIKE